MIIDAHTHIYPDSVATKALSTIIENGKGIVETFTDGTYSGLINSMDEAGVYYSVVLPVATHLGHRNSILQWIKETSHNSERLIFFGSVHPLDKLWRRTLKEMKENGVQGLKFQSTRPRGA